MPSSAVTLWWRRKASESVDDCTLGALWKVSMWCLGEGQAGVREEQARTCNGWQGRAYLYTAVTVTPLAHVRGQGMVETEALELAQEVCYWECSSCPASEAVTD